MILLRYNDSASSNDETRDSHLTLRSRVDSPATEEEIADSWHGLAVPEELIELWLASRESMLFEDVDYGQWGLHLLSPQLSEKRTFTEHVARPMEYRGEDIVVGEFLGDQDLLVFCPSEVGRRRVLVALPLDSRSDWYSAGGSLVEVLKTYLEHRGEKFWEAKPDLS